MKKVKVLLLLITCGLFNVNVFGGQPQQRRVGVRRGTPATVNTTNTPAKRNVSAANRAITSAAPPRASRQGRQAVATPAAQGRTGVRRGQAGGQVSVPGGRVAKTSTRVKAPTNVDTIVWDKLSEAQKSQFNGLNTAFVKTVSTVSKNYGVWQKTVVEHAKKIIDINRLLVDYCIDVINAELEKTAEQRGVDALEKSDYIARFLKQYASKRFMTMGTEKDQFNNLMEDVSIDSSTNLPTDVWMSEVINRAIKLVEKKELTIVEVRASLTAALTEAYQILSLSRELIEFVNDIVKAIEKHIKDVKEQNTPQYVNNRFQTLLLTLSDNANWNASRNQPTEEWKNDIIVTSKKMMALFNVSIEDIRQQIGAQIYYVAVKKANKFLNPQEEAEVIGLVNRIKEDILQ